MSNTQALKIPKGMIDWLMGRTHVWTPDEEIRADIRRRATEPDGTPKAPWTEKTIKQAQDYAIKSMEKNRQICRDFRL